MKKERLVLLSGNARAFLRNVEELLQRALAVATAALAQPLMDHILVAATRLMALVQPLVLASPHTDQVTRPLELIQPLAEAIPLPVRDH